jgi:TetR/AcrR family acrAB operon transcriptional repressor
MARRTKADAQTTRNNLLDAAEQLFQSRGVSRTSLNDIATAAGTTRGAIYWHFRDKADLFNAMMERVTLPLERTLVEARLDEAVNPVAEIRRAMLEGLRIIATDAQTRRVLQIATHQVEYTAELGAVLERHQHSHREWVGRNLQALQKTFALRQLAPPVSLAHVSLGLQALLEGLVQHWLLDPSAFDLQDVGRTSLDVFLAGLGLRPHDPPHATA